MWQNCMYRKQNYLFCPAFPDYIHTVFKLPITIRRLKKFISRKCIPSAPCIFRRKVIDLMLCYRLPAQAHNCSKNWRCPFQFRICFSSDRRQLLSSKLRQLLVRKSLIFVFCLSANDIPSLYLLSLKLVFIKSVFPLLWTEFSKVVTPTWFDKVQHKLSFASSASEQWQP